MRIWIRVNVGLGGVLSQIRADAEQGSRVSTSAAVVETTFANLLDALHRRAVKQKPLIEKGIIDRLKVLEFDVSEVGDFEELRDSLIVVLAPDAVSQCHILRVEPQIADAFNRNNFKFWRSSDVRARPPPRWR